MVSILGTTVYHLLTKPMKSRHIITLLKNDLKSEVAHDVLKLNHMSGRYNMKNTILLWSKFLSSDAKECKEKPSGRHQFHKDTECALNEQVIAEFNAAFAYLSMACYFGRTEIALPGCQGFFMNMHAEEHEHALIFLNYVLMRGGHVALRNICVPESHDWKGIFNAFNTALEMEKAIKEKLCAAFDVAENYRDLQVMDLISTSFMEEQNRSICEIARLLARAQMVENKVGEYLFDQLLFESFVKKSNDNLMYKKSLESGSENKVYK